MGSRWNRNGRNTRHRINARSFWNRVTLCSGWIREQISLTLTGCSGSGSTSICWTRLTKDLPSHSLTACVCTTGPTRSALGSSRRRTIHRYEIKLQKRICIRLEAQNCTFGIPLPNLQCEVGDSEDAPRRVTTPIVIPYAGRTRDHGLLRPPETLTRLQTTHTFSIILPGGQREDSKNILVTEKWFQAILFAIPRLQLPRLNERIDVVF